MDNTEHKKQQRRSLASRMNLLFLSVFLLFTLLIIRLGFVQIVHGEHFRSQSELTKNVVASVQTERGKMFDRNGKLIVSNIPSFALTYIRVQGAGHEEHLRYAKKITSLIEMNTKRITERDLQDYWILKQGMEEAYKMKLTEEEINSEELDDKELYRLLLDRITEEDLQPIKESEEDMQILAVKRELDSATNMDVTFIKKGLTEKEVAIIGEHLDELEGRFGISSTAERSYPEGGQFYFGNTGQIPEEQLRSYLLKGYARNDFVGVSNLEQQYEGVLSGKDKTYTFTTKGGTPVGSPRIHQGARGHDLVLSVDIDLNKKIGEILEENILKARSNGDGPVTSAYAVMMEPYSGEVLAMVGRELDGGKFMDRSYRTLQSSFEMGSTVKGATILAVHQMGEAPWINDMPIVLRGSGVNLTFSSFDRNRIGTVNDIQALEQSSNIYMGMAIGQFAGFRFVNNGSSYQAIVTNGQQFQQTFQKLRDVYSSVGLGVKTEIDLPNEALGYRGGMPITAPGMLLYYTIGQFDTYTPIQMAQYASLIANGGYRVQPHLLKEVRYSTGTDKLGPLVSKYKTNVINRVDNTADEIERVQKGFYEVTHGRNGTATYYLQDTKIAGKTGTAQISGPGKYNLTFVGYAPYDNPEIAFSVVVPNVNGGSINKEIVKQMVEAYNDRHKPEEKPEDEEEGTGEGAEGDEVPEEESADENAAGN
ncbi:penicillin-binding protein 2 [Pseudalkalibacillus sp. SCS-8]|uniref:peptidoglycan D,D-transpeptidase FtsI family protein n=1 Tax=Pseudalkalibacillus nanhaiensis TaxID=3115291 RepID=UPI0032DA4C97